MLRDTVCFNRRMVSASMLSVAPPNKHTEKHLTHVAKIDVSSMTFEEIDEKRKELWHKFDGMFFCTECDYSTKDKSNLKKHIKKHFVQL